MKNYFGKMLFIALTLLSITQSIFCAARQRVVLDEDINITQAYQDFLNEKLDNHLYEDNIPRFMVIVTTAVDDWEEHCCQIEDKCCVLTKEIVRRAQGVAEYQQKLFNLLRAGRDVTGVGEDDMQTICQAADAVTMEIHRIATLCSRERGDEKDFFEQIRLTTSYTKQFVMYCFRGVITKRLPKCSATRCKISCCRRIGTKSRRCCWIPGRIWVHMADAVVSLVGGIIIAVGSFKSDRSESKAFIWGGSALVAAGIVISGTSELYLYCTDEPHFERRYGGRMLLLNKRCTMLLDRLSSTDTSSDSPTTTTTTTATTTTTTSSSSSSNANPKLDSKE